MSAPTAETMPDLDAVYETAIEEGRAAAHEDRDRGIARLARVCGQASDARSRARAVGFVTGLAMVWEGFTLLDMVDTTDAPTLGTIDDAYTAVATGGRWPS